MCGDAEELAAGRILLNDSTSLRRIPSKEVFDYCLDIIVNSHNDQISHPVMNNSGDELERSTSTTHVNDSTSILGITCTEISGHDINIIRIINESR
jgi:hypothetical protein